MTSIVVVIKHGMVQEVLCNGEDTDVEVLDLDTQDYDEYQDYKSRLEYLKKTYKELSI